MSDFVSGFWNIYIALVTLVSILACGVLLKVMSTKRVPGKSVGTTGHVWDESLEEYNNPLPRWWFWMFVITIVFALIYLALYPGLGSYAGTNSWTKPLRGGSGSVDLTPKCSLTPFDEGVVG